MDNKIKRSLYYYDLELYELNSIENKVQPVKSFSKSMIKVFNDVLKLQNQKSRERIIRTDTSDSLFIVIDSIEKDYIEFKMVLSRTDALPFIELDGDLENLSNYIRDGQNIAEVTHCVLFPFYKIIGMEYNFAGAKSRAIREYFTRVSGDVDLLDCVPKLNFDAYSKLIENESFTLFDFAVKSNSKAYNNMLNKMSIFKVMRSTVPDSDVIEVIFKKRKKKSNNYKGFESFLSTEDMRELITTYRDDVQRFVVSQGSITSDSIDLLSDKLVKKTSFLPTQNRAIDSKQVYVEIKNFFESTVCEYCQRE